MSYDYTKHFVRNAYVTPPSWQSERFSVHIPARWGGRAALVWPMAAWGVLLVLPTLLLAFSDGVHNAREAAAMLGLLLVGGALLLTAGHFAFQHVRIRGDASELVVTTLPLPPRKKRAFSASAIARIAPIQRTPNLFQRLSARGPVDLTYQPWTIVVTVSGGEEYLFPIHVRPEEARRLAADLVEALAEAKRRRAERGGFRG